MKKYSILASLLLGFVTASVQAGGEVYKQVAPPPPPPVYGTGFYGAIDAGANVYQDLGSHTFDRSFNDVLFAGDALDLNVKLEPKHEVGFFGGIKLGYVFGTGVVRPTIEGDFFYNGFKPGFDVTGNAAFTPVPGGPTFTGSANGSFNTWVNTGAFLGNFILRFAPGNQRFQPYIGAGVGGFYAQTAGVNVEFEGFRHRFPREFIRANGVPNEFADLAWQAIAGADYYWTPKFSTFIEYHFLDYTSDTLVALTEEQKQAFKEFKKQFNINTNWSPSVGQHLVGVGVRFHF
jgi:opacity protein-like surface antigen